MNKNFILGVIIIVILFLGLYFAGMFFKNNQIKNYSNLVNENILLDKMFQKKDFGYTIRYPSQWMYKIVSQYTVVFSGKQDTPAFYSTVNIQNLASDKVGGIYTTIDDVITDFKNQLEREAQEIKFLEEKSFKYITNSGKTLTGKQFVVEYTRQGERFKQWQIYIPNPTGEIFYAWAYTSPIDQYETYLKIAEMMLDSWQILNNETQELKNGAQEQIKPLGEESLSNLPIEITVIKKPQAIEDFFGAYSIELNLKNNSNSVLPSDRFLVGSKGWNKDNVYYFSFACLLPKTNDTSSEPEEWFHWTTLDSGAKCSVTDNYDVAKYSPFSSIAPNQEGRITINFCGSAFDKFLITKDGKIAPKKEPPVSLKCDISLFYDQKLIGRSPQFFLDFAFDIY